MMENQPITIDLKSHLPNNPFDQMVFTSDLQIDDMVNVYFCYTLHKQNIVFNLDRCLKIIHLFFYF